MTTERKSIVALLFDWDGTLSDSATSGFKAFQKSLHQLGVHFNRELFDAHYSPNWYAMYEALRLPREQWQQADDLWVHHYGTKRSSLIDGALQTILELARRGFRLGIVTSGSHARLARELNEHQLTAHFQTIVCNEHVVKKKPHPEGLEHAMRLMKVEAGACAYVGDAPEDIEMGRAAGVFTVGVPSSYPSSKRLSLARPHLHLETINELLLHFSES